MKVHRTASITAVWRSMAGIDDDSINHVALPMKIFAYILGFLDNNSVATIAERTKIIDSVIKKLKPKAVVEIGAGLSSRPKRFANIEFYQLDLPYFKKFKKGIIPFEIGKDELDLKIKNALFIVEGVTMYLQEQQVLGLLREVKKYNGSLLIDFFDRSKSSQKKSLREKIYKVLFRLIVKGNKIFDYRIESAEHGAYLLKCLGYKNIVHYKYKVPKTVDSLFCAKI